MLDVGTILLCCAELSLPVLSSDRERKVQKTMGFLAHLFPLLFWASRKAGSPGGETFPFPAPAGAACKVAPYWNRKTKPKPSFSGFGLERRRNGMSLLSRLRGSK